MHQYRGVDFQCSAILGGRAGRARGRCDSVEFARGSLLCAKKGGRGREGCRVVGGVQGGLLDAMWDARAGGQCLSLQSAGCGGERSKVMRGWLDAVVFCAEVQQPAKKCAYVMEPWDVASLRPRSCLLACGKTTPKCSRFGFSAVMKTAIQRRLIISLGYSMAYVQGRSPLHSLPSTSAETKRHRYSHPLHCDIARPSRSPS